MNSHSQAPMLLWIACLGCNAPKDGEPTSSPGDTADPWAELGPIEVSDFRWMRTTELPNASGVLSLVAEDQFGPVFVRDSSAIFASDSLLRHDPRPVCIDETQPNQSAPVNPDGSCPEDATRVSRGAPSIPGTPLALAADPDQPRVGILSESGQLFWIHTDPLGGPPIDFMRPSEGPDFSHLSMATSPTLLALGADEIGIGLDNELHTFSTEGLPMASISMSSTITDLHRGPDTWWILTETELSDGTSAIGPGGSHLASWNNEPWVVSADGLTGPEGSVDHSGIRGPAVQVGEHLMVATETGIVRINPDLSASEVWEGSAIDLDVNNAGELMVLHSNGSFSAFVDERSRPDDATLHVWVSTFIERPRNPDDTVPCMAEDRVNLIGMLDLAFDNAEWLRDLPASVALGVTPSHMKRATECDQGGTHDSLFASFEPGILFHHSPTECTGDQDCHREALQEALETFGTSPMWASGLSTHTELGVDWIQSLHSLNITTRYAFFGMGLRPDLIHGSDLRGKDSWPVQLGEQSQVWMSESTTDLTDQGQTGSIAVMPGDSVPAFNLGGCANLWLYECHPLGRGDGHSLSEVDVESLDLLLHRALYSAMGEGVHTWNFHLPDIGLYDYTDGCEVDEHRWMGEDCEAGRLQSWLLDVHQRFATTGRISWAAPGAVPLP
jgi:hypothetical protein